MPLALILSSHVASSRVGGAVQALALAQLKIDPIVAPTVLFGRHPGWGAPGGGATSIEIFQGMLDGIEANGLFGVIDLVLTGYFAKADQVTAAARAIDKIRADRHAGAFRSKALVVVDPIMGDADRGLYVREEVATAIIEQLIPRADLVTPNAWELERLTGASLGEPGHVREAFTLMGERPILVSSVPDGPDIGVIYADRQETWLAAHPRRAKAPNGTGDLLCALFAAALIEEQPKSQALARAVSGVLETVTAAEAWSASELPVVALGPKPRRVSPRVRIERLV